MGEVIKLDTRRMPLRLVSDLPWPTPPFAHDARPRPVVPEVLPWAPTLPSFDDPKEPA
jgi:hypothetical protein